MISHAEFMLISPTGRTVIVADPEGRFEWIDTSLIVSGETAEGKPPPAARADGDDD